MMRDIKLVIYTFDLIYTSLTNAKYLIRRRDLDRFLLQCYRIGVRATPLVLLIGFFTGAIIAWQAAYQFQGIITLSIMGGQVTKVIFTEIGPVLTALILTGRIVTSIAAEIGSMKITEQINTLISLNLSPKRILAMPRILSTTIMLPILTIFSNFTGVLGALAVSMIFLKQTPTIFIDSIRDYYETIDVVKGISKSFVFGLIISSIGCIEGFNVEKHSEEVGEATISAFVKSAIAILLIDFSVWLIIF